MTTSSQSVFEKVPKQANKPWAPGLEDEEGVDEKRMKNGSMTTLIGKNWHSLKLTLEALPRVRRVSQSHVPCCG
jgi:hypothetical protein